MADYTVSLAITGDGSVAVKAVERVKDETSSLAAQGKRAGADTQRAFEASAKGATSMAREINRASASIARDAARAGDSSREAFGVGADAAVNLREEVEAVSRALEGAGKSAAAAGGGYDRAGQSVRDFIAEASALEDAMRHEAETLDDVIERREWYADALERNLLSQKEFASASAALDKQQKAIEKSLKDAGEEVSDFDKALDKVNLTSTSVMRNYATMVQQLARGDFAGFARSLSSLAANSGLLRVGLLGVGAAAGAAVVTVGALAAAFIAAHRENAQLTRGLIASGNAAGKTSAQVFAMARNLGEVTGDARRARQALTELATSGRVTGDALAEAGRAAVELSRLTGQTAAEAARQMEAIAQSPIEGLQRLDRELNIVDVSTQQAVRSLQQQGRHADAARVAFDALADGIGNRNREVVENLGYIETAAKKVKDGFVGAWEAVKGWGREKTADELRAEMEKFMPSVDLYTNLMAEGRSVPRTLIAQVNRYKGLSEELDALIQKERQVKLDEKLQATARAGKDAEARISALVDSVDSAGAATRRLEAISQDFAALWAAHGKLPEGIDYVDGQLSGPMWERIKASILGVGEAATSTGADLRDMAEEYVAALEKANELHGLSGTDLERAQLGDRGLSPDQLERAEAALDLTDALDAQDAAAQRAAASMQQLHDMQAASTARTAQLSAQLAGASRAEIAFARAVEQATRALVAAGGPMNPQAVMAYVAAIGAAKAEMETGLDLDEAFNVEGLLQRFEQQNPFEFLTAAVKVFEDQLADTAGKSEEQIARIERALAAARDELAIGLVAGAREALSSLQRLTKDGTNEFRAMESAIQLMGVAEQFLATRKAVTAILTQGEGDPYSAWARMAAMAAAVAPLLASIGAAAASFGGSGFSDTAARRQATQGTGTVLGDADAKSESIARAVEITADATQSLVAINRGMLAALQGLQAAIGGAAGMLARGAGSADFSGMDLAVGGLSGIEKLIKDPLGIFGGKSKVTDQGIIIYGGALLDMLEAVAVGAYQEVKSKSWAFGSTKTREGVQDVSDAFGRQFELIISSIVDTVREGALALGMLPDEVEAALAAYRIEEIRISLKDLSAEEQQAELEAVFSSIFDGLAGSVVPFIEQFQRVGEGLGETLVRVATEVQVTQEAVRHLGFALDETDPERLAQIADELIEMVGGVEEMISGMSAFFDAFAPDAWKFETAQETLRAALAQVGLEVPPTAEAMWTLMQTLDATTEAGREQIATLLRVTDAAKVYYDGLERIAEAQEKYADFMAGIDSELAAMADPAHQWSRDFAALGTELQDLVAQANKLARAAGMQGAAEADLVKIHEYVARKAAEMIKQLRQESESLASQLYGDGTAGMSIDQLNARIAELQGASDAAAGGIKSAVREIRSASDLLLGDLSPYSDRAKLDMAKDAFLRGEVSEEDVLRIAQRLFASTSQYTQVFDWVMANRRAQSSPGAGGTGRVQEDNTAELARLIEQRDALIEQQRREMAQELAANLAQYTLTTGKAFDEIAERWGFELDQLATDLGVADVEAYLQALQDELRARQDDDLGGALAGAAVDIVEAIRQLGADLIEALVGSVNPEARAPRVIEIPDGPGAPGGTTAFTPVIVNSRESGEEERINERLEAILQVLARHLPDVAQSTERGARESADLARELREALASSSRAPRDGRVAALPVG